MLIKIDPLEIHLTRLHDDQSNHTNLIKLSMKEFPYLCLNAKQLFDKIYDLWASNQNLNPSNSCVRCNLASISQLTSN